MLLYLKESSNFDKVNELTVLKHTTEAGIPALPPPYFFSFNKKQHIQIQWEIRKATEIENTIFN